MTCKARRVPERIQDMLEAIANRVAPVAKPMISRKF